MRALLLLLLLLLLLAMIMVQLTMNVDAQYKKHRIVQMKRSSTNQGVEILHWILQLCCFVSFIFVFTFAPSSSSSSSSCSAKSNGVGGLIVFTMADCCGVDILDRSNAHLISATFMYYLSMYVLQRWGILSVKQHNSLSLVYLAFKVAVMPILWHRNWYLLPRFRTPTYQDMLPAIIKILTFTRTHHGISAASIEHPPMTKQLPPTIKYRPIPLVHTFDRIFAWFVDGSLSSFSQ